MDRVKLYEDLANYLDRGSEGSVIAIGAPMAPSLIKILMILFPEEEAKIALKLPFINKTLSELKEIYSEKGDSIEGVLNSMVKHGTVYTDHRPGKEKRYRLLPSVVGWAETPFWSGKMTDTTKQLAPHWKKYRKTYAKELARNGLPPVRVVPVEESLKDRSEVLPFDVLKDMVDKTTYRAVGHCPCRMQAKERGEGCDYSLENCLHFGSMGRYMVEQGMAREISKEDTIDILNKADQEGLVHVADNMNGHTSTICNCCGCCCVFLTTKKELGLYTISSSNYLARVDSDECIGCGTCEERCPMGAIAVNDEGIAVVKEDTCIGCGICTPTCDTEAVRLAQRESINPPPDVGEFINRRNKAVFG